MLGKQRRTRSIVGAASLSVIGALTAAPATALSSPTDPDSAIAADTYSSLIVIVPPRQTIRSRNGRVRSDFGFRLEAYGEAFEIWSERSGYRSPIASTMRRDDGDVELPTGTLTDFSGLPDFVKLRVRRATGGGFVHNKDYDACLNGLSTPIAPEAPPRSPYPRRCPSDPYALGSVMGIQEAWGTRLLPGQVSVRLPEGRYYVTASIKKPYGDLFGIEYADRHFSTVVTVTSDAAGRDSARSTPGSREPQVVAPQEPAPATSVPGNALPDAALPDLRTLRPSGITLNRRRELLRFSATLWNSGTGELSLNGFREILDKRMRAYQYFVDVDGARSHQRVGTLSYHRTDRRWHYDSLVSYRLLTAAKQPIRRSRAQSFCLAPNDLVDATMPQAVWQPGARGTASCKDQSLLSLGGSLPAGNGDTEHLLGTGRAISVKNLPNGTYYLSALANPRRSLVESNTRNNDSLRRIRLGGVPGNRTLRVAKVGIVTE